MQQCFSHDHLIVQLKVLTQVVLLSEVLRTSVRPLACVQMHMVVQ